MSSREYQICTNCVMDTTDSKIIFDENGVCDHCNNYYNNLLPNWHPDERGAKELKKILEEIKSYGKGKKYDCIIGLSGGVDSSYLLYMAVEKWGLRPIVLAVDTGWNTDIAKNNINKIVNGLQVDLHRIVVDWEEMKDLQLAYLKSQIASQDVQDHAIFASLYNYAIQNKIKYVLTGANNSTECIREPVEWAYVNDLKNIKDIHRNFGTRSLNHFPTCSIFKYRLYYRYIKGMRVVKPLDLIPYKKNEVIAELEKRFGWESYGNKHYENIFTRFFEGYWLPKKFGIDKRRAHFSSLIVTEQLNRDKAIELISKPPYDEKLAMNDMEYIANKLDITKQEFIDLMNGNNKSYNDYKNSGALIKVAIEFTKLVGIEKRNFR